MNTSPTPAVAGAQQSVWFVYCGWRRAAEDAPINIADLILRPYDSQESALWALRLEAKTFWKSIHGFSGDPDYKPMPDFSTMDEQTIRNAFESAVKDYDPIYDRVLVEIREVPIYRAWATGFASLRCA